MQWRCSSDNKNLWQQLSQSPGINDDITQSVSCMLRSCCQLFICPAATPPLQATAFANAAAEVQSSPGCSGCASASGTATAVAKAFASAAASAFAQAADKCCPGQSQALGSALATAVSEQIATATASGALLSRVLGGCRACGHPFGQASAPAPWRMPCLPLPATRQLCMPRPAAIIPPAAGSTAQPAWLPASLSACSRRRCLRIWWRERLCLLKCHLHCRGHRHSRGLRIGESAHSLSYSYDHCPCVCLLRDCCINATSRRIVPSHRLAIHPSIATNLQAFAALSKCTAAAGAAGGATAGGSPAPGPTPAPTPAPNPASAPPAGPTAGKQGAPGPAPAPRLRPCPSFVQQQCCSKKVDRCLCAGSSSVCQYGKAGDSPLAYGECCSPCAGQVCNLAMPLVCM